MKKTDIFFMNRALELASKGSGSVSPNPMVGAVIINKNGEVIGEGYHERYGEGHAEVNALASVVNKTEIQGATMYVTLEPCSHYGKTPPCADRLVAEKVGRVVIGCTDPNPKVAGRGIQKLLDAGIEVEVGVEEEKCIKLNKRFFTAQNLKRPYIILKWAETADGFMDAERPEGLAAAWFTSSDAKRFVHSQRAVEDGVLVGRKTAEKDNPSLTVREVDGRNPKRLILSRNSDIDHSLNIFNDEAETIVVNEINTQVLSKLLDKKVHSLIVEGGRKTLEVFLKNDLWDEAYIFKTDEPLKYYYPTLSPEQINGGVRAPKMEVYPNLEELLESRSEHRFENCTLSALVRKRRY